jgi:hypothetical protein
VSYIHLLYVVYYLQSALDDSTKAPLRLLRFAVRPVLLMTAASVPVALFVAAAWAFAGSFYWEEGVEPTWGETTGYDSLSQSVIP